MLGSTLVTTRRSRVPWALVAAGVLVLGACGDDSDEAEEAEEGAAPEGLCAEVEDAQALGDLGSVEDMQADEVGALENLQAMNQGLLDLEVPEAIAEDWELYFSSAVSSFDSLIELQEGAVPEAGAGEEPEDLEDLEGLEDQDLDPSGDLQLMDDEDVIAAQDVVNDFLEETCDITI